MPSEPDPGLRNSATPRLACARIASARKTWLAKNSPAAVKTEPRLRRSTKRTPSSRSISAMCFETAG
jgi:hypothetical protein